MNKSNENIAKQRAIDAWNRRSDNEQKVRNCTTCVHGVSCEPNPFGICDEYEELI